jgi:cell division protein FtsW
MIGIMCNAARHEPEAVAALRAGRDDKMNRILRLPLPEPYVPTRLETFRDRKQSRPQSPRPPAPGRGRKAPQPATRKAARNSEPPMRPVFPRTAARSGSRSGHHGSGQRQARRARALEGQRYG